VILIPGVGYRVVADHGGGGHILLGLGLIRLFFYFFIHISSSPEEPNWGLAMAYQFWDPQLLTNLLQSDS